MPFTDLNFIFLGTDNILKFEPDPDEAVQDITGWILVFNVKDASKRSSTALITKTVGSGITITNGPAGLYQVSLTANDLDNLSPMKYYWEVSRDDVNNQYVMAYGIFVAKEHVVDLV